MATSEQESEDVADTGYAVEYWSGRREIRGEGTPSFVLSVADESQLRRVLDGDAYSTALAFIRGRFDVSGDLIAALRLKEKYSHSGFFDRLWTLAARWAPMRIETWIQSRKRAAQNIRSHYDISNDFYGSFLDSRFVYSAGYFKDPNWSLEQAQEAKLDQICRDLDLRPGERFLDVGSGWGALLMYAAARYQVRAVGCTLSRSQYEFTDSAIHARKLDKNAIVREVDYRDLSQRFDKIASIGMFEHVGRHRLGEYFRKIHSLLAPEGLFLNSGITRPETVRDDPQTWFLLKRVFPGGELPHLPDLLCAAERAGFSILRIQNLRKDYARTCQRWVERLREKKDTCVGLVGPEIYRTWLLYLAASALSFDQGETEVFSVLMAQR